MRFSKTCILWNSKVAFTILFFAAVNYSYKAKKRTLNLRNTQTGSTSTNHKSYATTFCTHWSELLFPKMSAVVKNTNVSWLLNLRIRVFEKRRNLKIKILLPCSLDIPHISINDAHILASISGKWKSLSQEKNASSNIGS